MELTYVSTGLGIELQQLCPEALVKTIDSISFHFTSFRCRFLNYV